MDSWILHALLKSLTFSNTSLVILSYHKLFLREYWYFLRELACTLFKKTLNFPRLQTKKYVRTLTMKKISCFYYIQCYVSSPSHMSNNTIDSKIWMHISTYYCIHIAHTHSRNWQKCSKVLGTNNLTRNWKPSSSIYEAAAFLCV